MSNDEAWPKDDRDFLEAALEKHLTERERKILYLYYGMDDGEERTPEEIGSLLGITRERVRQLLTRTTDKLFGSPEGARLAEVFQSRGMRLRSQDELEPLVLVPPVGLLVDPGKCAPEDLAALYAAISDVYRAEGGRGIAFRQEATEVGFVAGAV